MSVPYTFANQTGTIPLNELDENFAAVLAAVPGFAITAGTVTTAAQPNITAVGALNSLTVTGGITAGSVSGIQLFGTIANSAQPNITEIGTLSTLTVTNNLLAGSLTATSISTNTLSGSITTAAQPNITSVGTLSSLAVTGSIGAGSISANSITSNTLIYSNSIINNNVISTNSLVSSGGITGTLLTNAQPNITSVGTLSSLSVSGAVNAASVAATSVSGTSLSGTLATAAQPNITSLGTLNNLSVSGTITGTLATAAQPNITSLGTLTALAVSGIASAATAANGTSNSQVATTQFVANSVINSALPSGVILLWSGAVINIPSGWVLCDGSNGTPDLRGRFVVGAGGAYSPGATGGSANAVVVAHTHTATSVVTDPGHAHSYNAPSGTDDGGFSGSVVDNIVPSTTGSNTTGISVATTVLSSGVSGTNANLPPYYALAYIMKS